MKITGTRNEVLVRLDMLPSSGENDVLVGSTIVEFAALGRRNKASVEIMKVYYKEIVERGRAVRC